MTKHEFLERLRNELAGLPQEDVEERLTFYGEMIDDLAEDGLCEEDAVASVGTMEDIVAQIAADTPFVKMAKERLKPKKRMSAWTITLLILGSPIWLSLLILGSPIWLSLLIVALAVVFAVYVSLWAVVVSLWAVFASFVGCAIGGAVSSVVFACGGHGFTSAATLAVGLVCAGLSVFSFFGCRAATKGVVKLAKLFVTWLKSVMIRKGEAA